MELTRRRGLMVVLAAVTIGLPAVFLTIRLIAHLVAPHTYGPAGGYDIFTGLVAGVLFIFGFILAATLGATAGAADLQEGVFRHLVVTGRSRVAIYFSRIPAGLAVILPLIAIGYGFVCLVCTFAAPTTLSYDGVNVPAGLSRPALVSWAAAHYREVDCDFNLRLVGKAAAVPIPCGPNGLQGPSQLPPGVPYPTTAQLRSVAMQAANQDYADYQGNFLAPPINLMVRAGLWIELEAAVGFVVGLGLASLIGQRTLAVILIIVLEVILTPLLLRGHLPHLINFQRSIVGVATDHLRPSSMPILGGGGSGPDQAQIVTESRTQAALTVVAWLVVWSGLGAWRMAKRDV
jgi:hypothetical protein